MATQVPVVNQSYQQLATALGLDFNIQTTTNPKGLNLIVTPRFAAAAGTGKVTGELRMAKAECLYLQNGRGAVPLGLTEINKDLKAKIGQPCSAAIPAAALTSSAYMGASPAVLGGAALASWTQRGTVTLTGTVAYVPGGAPYKPVGQAGSSAQSSDYYMCKFEISGLPTADIVEFKPAATLTDRVPGAAGIKLRAFEAAVPGGVGAAQRELGADAVVRHRRGGIVRRGQHRLRDIIIIGEPLLLVLDKIPKSNTTEQQLAYFLGSYFIYSLLWILPNYIYFKKRKILFN